MTIWFKTPLTANGLRVKMHDKHGPLVSIGKHLGMFVDRSKCVRGTPLATSRCSLAARHSVPAMYQFREHAVAGGLMSYGTTSMRSIDKPASMPD
jgi:hypothetical protein